MSFDLFLPNLKLFIEKVERLENSSFLREILKEFRLGFSWCMEGGEKIESVRPSQDSIDAFVLGLRFFIQDNERISINNLQAFFN